MYQYTARDVKTGALFVSLAYTHNRHTAAIFVDRVLTHLHNHGIIPRIIQTDNGTDFVNTRNALDEAPLFIQVVTRNRITEHRRIPLGAKTWQSDVETSHWIIEREFYNYVKINSTTNFITKLRAYQWGFNVMRKNSYRGAIEPLMRSSKRRTNWNILHFQKRSWISLFVFWMKSFRLLLGGGYHVALPTTTGETRLLASAPIQPSR